MTIKHISIFLILASVQIALYAQDYYWYGNKKIPLLPTDKLFVIRRADSSVKNLSIEWHDLKAYASHAKEPLQYGIVNKSNIGDIVKSDIVYSIPAYKTNDKKTESYLSHLFYVKLKKEEDYELLRQYAEKYNVTIEPHNQYLSLWYVLSCLQSDKNALELANQFYESGLFAAAEPDLWGDAGVLCANDTYFSTQWNLNNTGEYGDEYQGIDINYCDIPSLVYNDNAVIAIVDQGIQLNHPDLPMHLFVGSYDSETGTSPSQVYGPHGTACAGIIGAKSNNDMGICGIAPKCPLMSISNYINTSYASAANRASGIYYAVDNGASVISNSWWFHDSLLILEDAITNAIRHGRNGKGCVVVFASGNDNNDSILYPANFNDSIIVVGAVSPCGERKSPTSCDGDTQWGSNYGEKLDIVAPGVLIPTIDRTGNDGYNSSDYNLNFRGTSAACPHVAAIAGLILSVNPYLTQKEVADIIESTAQKVGNYTYSQHAGRLNGTWNEYVGYGLIDAYEAIQEARDRFPIQGPDYVCDTTCFSLIDVPNDAVIHWTIQAPLNYYGNYSIVQGQGTTNICVEPTSPPIFIVPTDLTFDYGNRELMGISDMNGFVKATISTQDTVFSITKKLRSPHGATPVISASDTSYLWPRGQMRSFTVTNCANEPDSAFLWTARYNNNFISSLHRGRTFTYSPSIVNYLTISVKNTRTECGENKASLYYRVLFPLGLNAETENSTLNIIIKSIEEPENELPERLLLNKNNNYTLELWHSIYGLMKEQTVHSLKEQMDIRNLPHGTYVLLLKEDGNIVTQTKMML